MKQNQSEEDELILFTILIIAFNFSLNDHSKNILNCLKILQIIKRNDIIHLTEFTKEGGE